MAKNHAPKELPMEERAEFRAELKRMPADAAGQRARMAEAVELFNDAVRGDQPAAMEAAVITYSAALYCLNSGTMNGSATPREAFLKEYRAAPGVVPMWGQQGEYLLELRGLRARVTVKPWGLGGVINVELHAVSAAEPFCSETGYRSIFLFADRSMGKTLAAALLEALEGLMEERGMMTAIKPEYQARVTVPAWVAQALEHQRPDGQLAMFGDTPAPKRRGRKPSGQAKSPAERAKAYRERKREQRAESCVELVELGDEERAFLWHSVDVFMTVRADLGYKDKPYVLEMMRRIFKGWEGLDDKLTGLGKVEYFARQEAHRAKEQKRLAESLKQLSEDREHLLWGEIKAKGRERELQQEVDRLKASLAELESGLREIAAAPAAVEPVAPPATNACDRHGLATWCNGLDVKLVQLRSRTAGAHGPTEYAGEVVNMCAECRKSNGGMFKIVRPPVTQQRNNAITQRGGQ
ncbi:hypothetical protein [Pseudomonas nitroreducens]|uniref:hypothetical protein n=1 Tax=Pseudomonas nitroreducens TaxID=46680 RepID=UPI00265A19D9|nr:hypothetical protein [Pseudomonas nitroreducens]MCP1652725.1 hypothetical protein [Pseudomonas nitroreducens]